MRVSRSDWQASRLLFALFLFSGIILFATAVGLHRIDFQSLWFDEGWSAFAAAQSSILDAANADATNPPLYYALIYVYAQGAGTSEFSLRAFSLFWGLMVIALGYRFAFSLVRDYTFNAHRAGRVTAMLIAASPLVWWAGQEARMYTLLAALVLLCAMAFHRLRMPNAPYLTWVVLLAGELALLYTHNTAPVVVLWLNIVWLIDRLLPHSRRSQPIPIIRWLLGQACVGILWLPYFVTRFLTLANANNAVRSAPILDATLLLDVWRAFWETPWERVIRTDGDSLFTLSLLILAFGLIAWRQPSSRWLLLHTGLLIVGLIGALIVLQNPLHGRYLVMVAPLLLVALGIGIASGRGWRRFALLPFIFAFALNGWEAQSTAYHHDDARAMARYYAETLTAEDSVLMWSYADRYEFAYYWAREGVTARRITLPEGGDLEAVRPLFPRTGDVSLNVWYTQRADYRGMMGCMLAHGTVEPPTEFTVNGMTSRLYRQPAWEIPSTRAVDIAATGANGHSFARLFEIGLPNAWTPDRAQCLPLTLEMLTPVTVDLKAVVIVTNALNHEIARADAIFAQADQRLSSTAGAGTRLSAYPSIRLPYGTPAGEYQVSLRIYDEQAVPSGYVLSGNSLFNNVPAREIDIGRLQMEEGAAWGVLPTTPDLTRLSSPMRVGDVALVASDILESIELSNGDTFPITLLWEGEGALPDLEWRDVSGAWSVPVPPDANSNRSINAVRRDWRNLQVPNDATNGMAELVLDNEVLARYTVAARPFLTESLPVDTPLNARFPGVGTLLGAQLPIVSLAYPSLPQVTLIWEAEAGTPVPYTVFVQLIDSEGGVAAQSDSEPLQGSRPTPGWRAGEYLIDTHTLTWNFNPGAGALQWIAGFYDPMTGERVRLENGDDFVSLTTHISFTR